MTATSASETAAPRLRPPRNRVERRAIVWWTLRSFINGALLIAVLGIAYLIWDDARSWLQLPILILAGLVVVNVLVQPWWRYKVHRWESTQLAVYGRSGWLVREWRVAPISRIQTVDAVRGPLEQMLGLSTLRVTTASSRGAINVAGLDKEVAADWAEKLTVITEQTEGDAT